MLAAAHTTVVASRRRLSFSTCAIAVICKVMTIAKSICPKLDFFQRRNPVEIPAFMRCSCVGAGGGREPACALRFPTTSWYSLSFCISYTDSVRQWPGLRETSSPVCVLFACLHAV